MIGYKALALASVGRRSTTATCVGPISDALNKGRTISRLVDQSASFSCDCRCSNGADLLASSQALEADQRPDVRGGQNGG